MNKESFCSVDCGYLFTSLKWPEKCGEELKKKKKDTKWLPRLQIFARSSGSWNLYSLEILTPIPRAQRSVNHLLQGEVWYQPPVSLLVLWWLEVANTDIFGLPCAGSYRPPPQISIPHLPPAMELVGTELRLSLL